MATGATGASGSSSNTEYLVTLNKTGNDSPGVGTVMYRKIIGEQSYYKKQFPSITCITDLEQFLITNSIQFQPYTAQPTGTFTETNLRKLIFDGLEMHIDELFTEVIATLRPIIQGNKAPQYNAFNAIAEEFDYNNETHISVARELNVSVELTYTDRLTKKNLTRTVNVKLAEFCDNFKTCKQKLAMSLSTTHALIESQSLFIEHFLENILQYKVMNVSNARALFETLSPTDQCDISEKIKLRLLNDTDIDPEHTKIERLNDKYAWKKYCYICGNYIADYKNHAAGSPQCEHILFVIQACAVDCLIQNHNKEQILQIINSEAALTPTQKLILILYELSYAGGEPCCNILKSDIPFIDISEDVNGHAKVEENMANVKAVLKLISEKAADTNDRLKCNLIGKPITSNHEKDWKAPSAWEKSDIDKHANRINEFWLQPLCIYLRKRLASGKEGEYSPQGLIRVFTKMLLMDHLEVSVNQAACCLLTNGAIKLPIKLITRSCNQVNKLLVELSRKKIRSNCWIGVAFKDISDVKILLYKTIELLKQHFKIPSQRSASLSPLPESSKHSKHDIALQAFLTLIKNEDLSEYTTTLQELIQNLSSDKVSGQNAVYSLALYKNCFNLIDPKTITEDAFVNYYINNDGKQRSKPHSGNIIGTLPNASLPNKLYYYLNNLTTMLYDFRPKISKMGGNEDKAMQTGFGFEGEITAFSNLCKSYIALEFMYILTYNLHKKKLTEVDASKAVTILQDCILEYNKQYTIFILKWFLYSCIYMILISDINVLIGHEAEGNDDTQNREDHILHKMGGVYYQLYKFLQLHYSTELTQALETIRDGIDTIDNESIKTMVNTAFGQFENKIADLLDHVEFIKLICVKGSIVNPKPAYLKWLNALPEFAAPTGATGQGDATGPSDATGQGYATGQGDATGTSDVAETSLGGIAMFSRRNKNKTAKQSKLSIGIKKNRTQVVKKSRDISYRDNYDPKRITFIVRKINQLEIAVYTLRAYDIGYVIIDKLIPIIYMNKYEAQQSHLYRIEQAKKIININKAKRAEYALTKLLGYNKTQAESSVRAVLLHDTSVINKIITTMGQKINDNIQAKVTKNYGKPMFTVRYAEKRMASSKRGSLTAKRQKSESVLRPLNPFAITSKQGQKRQSNSNYSGRVKRRLTFKNPAQTVRVILSSTSKKRSRISPGTSSRRLATLRA